MDTVHYVAPHWTPDPPPPTAPRWSPAWVAVVTLCVLLGVALIIVVVLGATGILFPRDAVASNTSTASGAALTGLVPAPDLTDRSPAARFPTNSIEHTVLKVPSYDPVAVSREEEQQLTREQPVLQHLQRASTFEALSTAASEPLPAAGPRLTVTIPTSQDVRGAPRPPQMLPFHTEHPPFEDVNPARDWIEAQPTAASSDEDDDDPVPALELTSASRERHVVLLPPPTDDTALVAPEVDAVSPPLSSRVVTPPLADTASSSAPVCAGLQRFIEYVVYINLDENPTKRADIEHEIEQLGLPDFVPRERLSAVKRSNTALGNFLSKIACLTKALSLKKNVLILEDDFRLDATPAELLEALQTVEAQFGNRWDVVALAQNVDEWQTAGDGGTWRVMRVLHSHGSTGLLVNKLYVPRLLAFWIQRLRALLHQSSAPEARDIAHAKTELQRWDLWLTFFPSAGYKADDRWNYLADLQHATDGAGVCQRLTLAPPLVRQRVAVCHLATGHYNQFVTAIQNDCYLKFLKMHHIEFFLFTDQAGNYPVRTEEGAVLHTYSLEARGYPHDNLYRFHYLLQAEDALQTFDYVYYMDVDYRLYQHPAEKQLMVPGVVATAHLHNIVEKRDGSRRHIGSPETRPESTACIHPDETMAIYYTSSFHGGQVASYLAMCRTLRERIDADARNGLTAKWLEESHLNRFLLDHPPASVLSQSYIFSERCLDLECRDPLCNALRESRIQPIMGTQM